MKHPQSDYDVVQDLTVASQLAALYLYGDRRINRSAVARQLASEVLGLDTKVRQRDEPFFQDPVPVKLVPWNEPVFLLRAEDLLSDETLAFWIQKAQQSGVNSYLVNAVIKHLEIMKRWPNKRLPEISKETLDAMLRK